jgi:hypothetical protein
MTDKIMVIKVDKGLNRSEREMTVEFAETAVPHSPSTSKMESAEDTASRKDEEEKKENCCVQSEEECCEETYGIGGKPGTLASSLENGSNHFQSEAGSHTSCNSSINYPVPTELQRVNAPLGGDLDSNNDEDSIAGDDAGDRFPPLDAFVEGRGLSIEDIEICQRLDEEYERALEEREIGYNARYQSVRQSACLSITFMLCYLVIGVLFYTRYAGWNVTDSLFFLVYTITTVGYGSNSFPADQNFQLFTICYIFSGIATLTIMVAQVYQCIALEATRAQHARDKAELAKRGKVLVSSAKSFEGMTSMQLERQRTTHDLMSEFHENQKPSNIKETCLDWFAILFERCKWLTRDSEMGRAVSFIFPMAGLMALGACVVGPIEGWSVVESIYFATVSLTTTGYGEYKPTKPASIWFCIFWLPFSVGFMSIYLGSVAAFYIRLSDQNIHRLERNMRRRIKRAKVAAEKERLANIENSRLDQVVLMGSDDVGFSASPPAAMRSGFEALNKNDEPHPLFGSAEADAVEFHADSRRQRILEQSNHSLTVDSRQGQTMQTMRDILRAIKTSKPASSEPISESANPHDQKHPMMSFRSTEYFSRSALHRKGNEKPKPSFALRVLVQERFAEIVATDIAGFQSHIEIKENTLAVTIDTLKNTADKWLVPRRARKAFRAVSFEALYFVGEHGLITRGADALYDLSPFEFHGLFSPLVAAMGDAETMEGWLNSTDVLADVDLRRDGTRPGLSFIADHTPPIEGRQRGSEGRQRGVASPAFPVGVAAAGAVESDSFCIT